MRQSAQGGYASPMLISLIVACVFLVVVLSFGVWAFSGRQDYKNNSDQKAAKAAAEAKAVTEAADAIKYAEAAKNPLKTHVGPAAFGAVTVIYPKTWSGYVIETGKGTTPVIQYYHPDLIPDVSNDDMAIALRVNVLSQSYDSVLHGYNSLVQSKKITVKPFSLAKVPTVIGSRIDGQIEQNKQGSVVILPLRNMTLQIMTESNQFMADFDKIILPNLTFSP